MIHYQNMHNGKPNHISEIQQVPSVRDFLIADNIPIDNGAIRNQVTQNYQQIKNKFKAPFYFISTDISLESVDLAFSEIGEYLKNANELTTLIDDSKNIFFLNILSIGVLSFALLCFWIKMEAYNWDFKIQWQILIYIGILIATIVGEGLIFAAIYILLKKFDNIFTGIILAAFIIFFGPIQIAILLQILVIVIQNRPLVSSQYLWSLITFTLDIPVCFYIQRFIKSKTWNEEANARIARVLQYKKFRLNQ
ncbi:hypothetical protein FGO68_gene1817 [Halteria grandinella]|uniref:Uncharacterized protein n=1 Tax=Halteria grandinella TaxID=5974 RepID=A0A8J8NN26_HALGN|nr:hypothetical protein FGO68_gene1817 [Halteria grandinella]